MTSHPQHPARPSGASAIGGRSTVDWDSFFDEEDDFASIFALLESADKSKAKRGGSQLRRAKNIDQNRVAGPLQLQRD